MATLSGLSKGSGGWNVPMSVLLLESLHKLRVAAHCHQVGVLANQVSIWEVGEGGGGGGGGGVECLYLRGHVSDCLWYMTFPCIS